MIQRHVIIITGKTGSGKSTLAKNVIQKCKRVFILDPMHEYPGTVVYTMEQLFQYMERFKPDQFMICCRFEDDTDIEFFFRFVWHFPGSLIVVEEVDSYVNPRVEQTPFMRIIRRGRHRKLHILGIAQRTPQFSSTLRAQKTTFVSFAVDEPIDLDTLELYGFSRLELEQLTIENHQYALIGTPLNDIDFAVEKKKSVFVQE